MGEVEFVVTFGVNNSQFTPCHSVTSFLWVGHLILAPILVLKVPFASLTIGVPTIISVIIVIIVVVCVIRKIVTANNTKYFMNGHVR